MAKQIFLPSDGPTGTPSLRTLGTGATQAGAGNDSRFSDARTPTAHASTHNIGGADVLEDLTRQAGGPANSDYLAWNFDSVVNNGAMTPAAGVVYLAKIATGHAFTISTIDFAIKQAGTGVTALANCFIGIYDSGGTRRYVSADQASNWATPGTKSLSLGGSAYTVTANSYIYIAFLVGTQSTTALQFVSFGQQSQAMFAGGAAATSYRWASQLSGQTSLPSPITLSSNTLATLNPVFFGAK